MLYLYGIKLPDEVTVDDYECLFQSVSKDRQLSIQKFHFDVDRKRSMFAEVLLRFLLDRHLSIREQDLSFKKNQYGKPSLLKYEAVHYNCSHSGDWVLCAVGDAPLGVDVEVIKSGDLDIAKRFFTGEEYTWLQELNGKERDIAFYKLWTLKESYVKALGKGLAIPLDSFSFYFGDSIELKTDTPDSGGYSFWSEQLDQSHMASLCCLTAKVSTEDIKFHPVSYDTVLSWLKG